MKKHLVLPLAIYLTSTFVCLNGYCRIDTQTNVGTNKIGIQLDLKSGSLDFLKQEKQINLEFVYDGMTVDKLREEDYVAQKVEERNKQEAGRGDRWRDEWIQNRAAKFQPKFQALLNKQFSSRKKPLQFGSFKDSKYTLILKTTFTEPGWHAGVINVPAYIDADAIFVETQNRAEVAAVITITKAPGWSEFDFDVAKRIQESYAKAGKELGIFISKQIK